VAALTFDPNGAVTVLISGSLYDAATLGGHPPSDFLLTNSSGASPRVAYWTAPTTLAGDANMQWDAPNARLFVGTPIGSYPGGFAAKFIAAKQGGATGFTTIVTSGALATDAPFLSGARARGTIGGESAVLSGDSILRVNASGFGQTAFSGTRARVEVIAAENWSDVAQGTYMTLSVTRATTTTLAEVVRAAYNLMTVTGGISATQAAVTAGATAFSFTPGAHTALVAEIVDANFALNRTVMFANFGEPTMQRAALFQNPTYDDVGGGGGTPTLADAATVAITDAPAAGSANITITRSMALWVQSGATRLAGPLAVGTFTTSLPVTNGSVAIRQAVSAASAPDPALLVVPGQHTALAASSIWYAVNFAITGTQTWQTGALAEQDFFRYAQPTIAFVGDSTVSDAASTAMEGPPLVGAHATITRAMTLWVKTGWSRLGGGLTVGTGTTAPSIGAILTTQSAVVAGATALSITAGAHTSVTAETIDVNFNLARTVTFTGGSAPATQRAVVFQAPTYSDPNNDTTTTAATVAITGAPVAAGAGPLVITNSYALWVQGGGVLFAGGLNVGAAGGATAGQILDTWNDSGTNNQVNITILARTSNGTPAVNFGVNEFVQLHTSNNTLANASYKQTRWLNATNGSQLSTLAFGVYDITTARTGLTLAAVTGGVNVGVPAGGLSIVGVAISGGATTLSVTPGAHTAGAVEIIDVNFNLARTVTFTHGSVPATERAALFQAPTYASSAGGGGDTITTAATLAISGAPIVGANLTGITNPYALWVQGGGVLLAGGLNVGTATGAGAGQVNTSSTVIVGLATETASANITVLYRDSGTNNQSSTIVLEHRSSGTPTTLFGQNIVMQLDTDNNTLRTSGAIQNVWVTATDASRKSRVSIFVYDATTAREVVKCESDGSNPLVGFLSAAAVGQQSIGAALAAYVDGTHGLDTAAHMQALFNQVANITIALKNFGLCKT
jgi:hypothetical protein